MTARTCSVDGCDRPHRSRGWCVAHYFRWRRHGDPLARRQRIDLSLTADDALRLRNTAAERGLVVAEYVMRLVDADTSEPAQ